MNKSAEHLYDEHFMLYPHDEILTTCRSVNAPSAGVMDWRPPLEKSQEEVLIGKYPSLFYFFTQRRFLERDNLEWTINSKLDDEWAVNVFSKDVDLLATGIYKLDDVLKGGFRLYRDPVLTELYQSKSAEPCTVTLQGRPGTGKTTLALQILSNFAAQGYSTVYASAEQSIESLKRIIRRFCKWSDWSKNANTKIARCRLAKLPLNDRSRLAKELGEIAKAGKQAISPVWLKDVWDVWSKSFVDSLDTQENASAAAEFARKLEMDEKLEGAESLFSDQPSALDFFVLVLDQASQQETKFAEKLVERGWHGIVLAPVDFEDSERPQPAGELGAFLRLSNKRITESLKSIKKEIGILPSWFAVDSVTAFDGLGSRQQILALRNKLKTCKLPTSLFFLTEAVSDDKTEQPTELEVLSDKIISLGERPLQIAEVQESASNYMQRYLEVRKCRLGPFHRGKHPIAIKSYSVKVYRSIAILLKVTGKRRRNSAFSVPMQFGIEGLDGAAGLGDSIREGSVTVLSGPPGSHKTAIASYFLMHPIVAHQRAELPAEQCPKSIIYSFGGDRRGVESGLRPYIDSAGKRLFTDTMVEIDGKKHDRIMVRDISPGYLFPEAFIEDLIDNLRNNSEGNDKEGRVKRIVFDSFDSVHAAFPIMRMDQFLWKLIFQVCWDYGVSAMIKVSSLERGSEYYHNMASLVTSMADNIISLTPEDSLQVIESESGSHPRIPFQLETEYWHNNPDSLGIIKDPGRFPCPMDDEAGLLLRVKREIPSRF
jgi:KaiC/GvpD/RAD55 family RecA-like ATPase